MSALARPFALIAVVLLTMFPSAARSCSCFEYLTEPAEQLKESGLVFTGTVVSVTVVTLPRLVYSEENGEFVPSQFMDQRAVVTLRTTREWKGNGSATYTVLAGAPPDPPLPAGYVVFDCEQHLDVGKEYLVFATEGYPEASSCALGGLVEERSEAIEALDAYVKKNAKPSH